MTLPDTCGLTLTHYQSILTQARRTHTITDFAAHRRAEAAGKPVIILRHDLDRSFGPALEMARIEYELGVTATYFVELHSDFYTPFSHTGTRALHSLLDFGHEVGLHYDPTYYADQGWSFDVGIHRDVGMLSDLVGKPVVSVSRHLPLLGGQKPAFPAQIEFNAYDPRFINGQYKYISDSNGIFREGCFCGHIGTARDYCFLVHPVWWSNRGVDWQTKLRNQAADDGARIATLTEQQIGLFDTLLSERAQRDVTFRATVLTQETRNEKSLS